MLLAQDGIWPTCPKLHFVKHVDHAIIGIGIEWARLRMSKPWESQKLRLDSHPETGRSGANYLPVFMPVLNHVTWRPNQGGPAQHLDHFSTLMRYLSSLNLQPVTFSHPGFLTLLP